MSTFSLPSIRQDYSLFLIFWGERSPAFLSFSCPVLMVTPAWPHFSGREGVWEIMVPTGEAVNPENVANLSHGCCFRTGYKRKLVHLRIDD